MESEFRRALTPRCGHASAPLCGDLLRWPLFQPRAPASRTLGATCSHASGLVETGRRGGGVAELAYAEVRADEVVDTKDALVPRHVFNAVEYQSRGAIHAHARMYVV